MRLVIDSNQMQKARLRKFLSRSSQNQAVLTDFVAMEAYKGNTLNSIFKSMAIVSDFPKQVLILKGSRKLFGCRGRRKGLQRRLVDKAQTDHFSNFVEELQLAKSGNVEMQQQVLKHGQAADEHFSQMLLEAEELRPILDVLGKEFSKEERAILRTQESYTSVMKEKLSRTVVEIAEHIIRDSPFVHRRPSFEELPNTYFFRVTLACYLMGITRAAHGDVTSIRPDKLRNDLVDMTLVSIGTYFDGVLSADERVNTMFDEVCIILSGLFEAEVPALARLIKQ